MREAQPFTAHYVDIQSPRAEEVVRERLRDTGLITLSGFTSRTVFREFAARIMDITPHRDSDPDGLTVIRDTRRHTHLAGYGGFGNCELAPHTERSGVPNPPRLMLLVCGTPALYGGDCLLTDGRSVYTDITARRREAIMALSKPRTAFFGGGDGHATQVFTEHPDGRVSVRLRLDGHARFSPTVQTYLPYLRSALTTYQIRLPLGAGQGYLLDNERWLHAREAFTGSRLCWRALGEPRFRLPTGFAPASRSAITPTTAGPVVA
ncbi:TauD/TfdA family dioxygenase [Streptomyces abikoensis]|uniref:Putative Taurine catabolism dioxygenase TauD/TfdA n=1 Tax=Streptomyces albireticuli TaxID=1940 RepID=A0A1Z2KXF8_9ACTN|nr:TauD/TfdA family dioxygenase [Streptomyces albireticuli]ARZ66735.1 putative Taurine catabolism dioxygenase TauD/TfdA [Streptomyces albireticuli]